MEQTDYVIKSNTNEQKRNQIIGIGFLSLISFITVLPIMALIVYIVTQGLSVINWTFLTSFPENGMRDGGIMPAILGTFYLTLGTSLFSIPPGIAAAIYLAEYASENRLTRLIRIAMTNLAGIPSVVYGLLGLSLFVFFLQFGTSILAASLTLKSAK